MAKRKEVRSGPSIKDYSEACKEYRKRTGRFLAYRDFQSGKYIEDMENIRRGDRTDGV